MAEGRFVLTRIGQTLVTLQGAADAGALSAPSYSAGPGVAMSTIKFLEFAWAQAVGDSVE